VRALRYRVLFHPDCDRRLRDHTGICSTRTLRGGCGARGLGHPDAAGWHYRRWGLSPRPENVYEPDPSMRPPPRGRTAPPSSASVVSWRARGAGKRRAVNISSTFGLMSTVTADWTLMAAATIYQFPRPRDDPLSVSASHTEHNGQGMTETDRESKAGAGHAAGEVNYAHAGQRFRCRQRNLPLCGTSEHLPPVATAAQGPACVSW